MFQDSGGPESIVMAPIGMPPDAVSSMPPVGMPAADGPCGPVSAAAGELPAMAPEGIPSPPDAASIAPDGMPPEAAASMLPPGMTSAVPASANPRVDAFMSFP